MKLLTFSALSFRGAASAEPRNDSDMIRTLEVID